MSEARLSAPVCLSALLLRVSTACLYKEQPEPWPLTTVPTPAGHTEWQLESVCSLLDGRLCAGSVSGAREIKMYQRLPCPAVGRQC